MKTILLYGARGYIGDHLLKVFDESKMQIVCPITRLENKDAVCADLARYEPDYVVSCTGRTHGRDAQGNVIGTIDYLENPDTLDENIKDNLFGPVQLALLCDQRNIHYTYIGTGCIYHSDYAQEPPTTFDEEMPPNFKGSAYSLVKGYTDRLLASTKALVLRIRLPLASKDHPRNTLSKLVSYPAIHSLPNSVTCFSMWKHLPYMMECRLTGVFNFVNKGSITNDAILRLYREHVDPTHTWELVETLHVAAARSNTVLDTNKLERIIPELETAQEAVKRCVQEWH